MCDLSKPPLVFCFDYNLDGKVHFEEKVLVILFMLEAILCEKRHLARLEFWLIQYLDNVIHHKSDCKLGIDNVRIYGAA